MSREIPILNYGGSAGSYSQDNNRSMGGNYPPYPDRNSQIGSAGERYPNPNQGSGIGSAGNQGYGRGPYEPEIGTGVRPEYSSGQGGFGSNTRMPDNPTYSDRSGGIGSGTQYNPPYPGSGMGQGGIGTGARPDYGSSNYPGSGQGGIGTGARSDYGPNYPNSGYGQGGYGSDTRPGYNPSSNYPSRGYEQGGIGMGARPAEAPPYRDVGFSQPSYGNQGPPPLSRDPRMKPDQETRVYDPYAECMLHFTPFEFRFSLSYGFFQNTKPLMVGEDTLLHPVSRIRLYESISLIIAHTFLFFLPNLCCALTLHSLTLSVYMLAIASFE